MNWKRGLLRLWVLASAVWIIGAGSLIRADTIVMDFAAKTYDRLSITATPDGPWLNHRPDYANFTPPQRVALATARHRLAQHRLANMSAFLLLPSIGTLAVGAAGIWVGRGFRKTEI